MNKHSIRLIFAVLSAAASCAPADDAPETAEQAHLRISLDTGDGSCVRAPYDASEVYESQVNDVQVLVFDEEGRLNAYKSTSSKDEITMTTTFGSKTVWAVVNGPDLTSVRTLKTLASTSLDLGDNSVVPDRGFVMAGSAEVAVDKDYVPAFIDVRRLTSRVAVCSIANRLPEAYPEMTIESVMLANVPGNQNIAGTAAISTWYNRAGRHDGACPDLTFCSPGETVSNGGKLEKTWRFYSYPNNTVSDASGWTDPFTARKTRLVVTAVIAGERYHYPVVLESLERNKAYTVNMTITGLGSSDPDRKVEKGTVSSTVLVKAWDPGAEYTETI